MTLGAFLLFAEQPYPWLSFALAALGVVIIGIAKSGFGSGVGIIAVPLFVFALGAKPGVSTLLPLLIAADIFSVYHHWGTWDKPNLRHLLPGSMAGILLGAVGLYFMLGRPPLRFFGGATETASPSDIQASTSAILGLVIGVLCVLYVVGDFIKSRYASGWHFKTNPVLGTSFGAAAGFVSTLAHGAGPVTTIYMLGQHLPKQRFIGTAVIYYFIINTVKLIPYALLPMINTRTLVQGLVLLPFVPVGTFIGVRLNRWMSEKLFRGIILTMVVITAVDLIRRHGVSVWEML